jgi:hypothetical protein
VCRHQLPDPERNKGREEERGKQDEEVEIVCIVRDRSRLRVSLNAENCAISDEFTTAGQKAKEYKKKKAYDAGA